MMLVSVALAASVAAGQPAAQSAPPNVPDWSQGKNRGSASSIEFYQGLADCVAYRWPALGGAFVVARPGSAQETEALGTLKREAGFCVASGQVRLERHWLRGVVAEQLLKRKSPLPRPPWLSGGESPDALQAKLRAAYSGNRPNGLDRRDLAMRAAAHCTVGDGRPLVEALLGADPGSHTEMRALTQLNPTLSKCLTRGAIRTMGAPSVRAYLAEAVYWRRALEGVAQ